MVRSLQASRTSLEKMSPVGSCASGTTNTSSSASTLPRSRRGLSPHGIKIKDHAVLSILERRFHEGERKKEDAAGDATRGQQPTVETPLSPESQSLPPLYLSNAREAMDRLHIEEMPEEAGQGDEASESPSDMLVEELEDEDQSYSLSSDARVANIAAGDRPNRLDLFSQQSAKKKIYHFNNPSK